MKTGNYKILIVDDEPDILEILSYNLKKEGYHIFKASNGYDAINIAKEKKPHLILLDIMMPGIDGIETCNQIRKISYLHDSLIAFLTARIEDYSQVAGFDSGADDYILKPIKPKILLSKIKALLRRSRELSIEIEEKMEFGDIIIDKEKYIFSRNKEKFHLPKKEFELLLYMASNPGRVFSRDEILSKIWGDNIIVGDRTIDVHIRKLREKIGDDYITTIKGIGYKFELK